jgi:hypothetical protein
MFSLCVCCCFRMTKSSTKHGSRAILRLARWFLYDCCCCCCLVPQASNITKIKAKHPRWMKIWHAIRLFTKKSPTASNIYYNNSENGSPSKNASHINNHLHHTCHTAILNLVLTHCEVRHEITLRRGRRTPIWIYSSRRNHLLIKQWTVCSHMICIQAQNKHRKCRKCISNVSSD